MADLGVSVVGVRRLVDGGLRRGLISGIQCGLDGEAAALQQLFAVLGRSAEVLVIGDQAGHVVTEIGGLGCTDTVTGNGGDVQVQSGGDGGVVLFLRDASGIEHPLEHQVAPFQGSVRVQLRAVGGGAVDHAGQQRRLRNAEVLGVYVEEVAGGGLYSVRAAAEGHDVEVALKDLVLAELFLHGNGKFHFPQLVAVILVTAENDFFVVLHIGVNDHVVDVLLRDGGRTAVGAAGSIGHQGADDALHVHAAVFVEPVVFDGQHGVDHVRRHLVEGHRLPVLVVQRGDQGAVVGIDLGGGRQGSALQLRGELVEELDGAGSGGSCRRGRRNQETGCQDPAKSTDAEERDELSEGGRRVEER